MISLVIVIKQNLFIMMIALVGAFGCVAHSLAGKGLMQLLVETSAMNSTTHPFLKQLKLKRENGLKLNKNLVNSDSFVVKNLDRYRYLNLSVRDYIKIAWFFQLLCVMLGLVGGIAKNDIWYLLYGFVCALAIFYVGKIEDEEQKEKQIVANIVDYFDNFLTFDKKIVETEREVDYNIDNVQIQEAPKEREYTSEEQRKLIEEVLKEYLA